MTDSISHILIADPAYCAAAKKYAEVHGRISAAAHQGLTARSLGDLEGWLMFARQERELAPEMGAALAAQTDAGITAVERWLGPAPTVAQGETP